VVAIFCCSHTVYVLLSQGGGPLPRQGQGQKRRKRLGYQPSHVISGLARYSMTKILGRQKHAEFLRQLRLVDISLRLERISGVRNTGF
jgi:hypothetical protein